MAKARVLVVLAAVVLGGGGACGHSPDPVATPTNASGAGPVGDVHADGSGGGLDADLDKLAKLSVAMYKDIASAFTVAGADCKAATAKLGELTATAYKDVPAANAKVLRDHRAKEMRAALAPYQADLDAAGQSIATSKTMSACSSDKAFEDAFDRLEAPP